MWQHQGLQQGWCCSLAFIECIIHRDDCSKELLEWGSRVQGVPPELLCSLKGCCA